ncbi:phage holin family protein [Peribacillus sp. SCS-37]|uniref:phage holin family protein n=1 Tax=Paraperibacillus esterisolvens TaxID=3115296 RepID=UPI003906C332
MNIGLSLTCQSFMDCLMEAGIYVAGGMDKLLLSWFIMVSCELAGRAVCLICNKELSCKHAIHSILKKMSSLLLLIAAVQLDIVMGNAEQFIRSAAIVFLIGNEGIAIMENLNKLGLRAPAAVSRIMDLLGEKDEEGPSGD